MAESQLNPLQDSIFPVGEVSEARKRTVLLEMSNLIRAGVHEINGPEIHFWTSVCEMGFKTVTVSFDSSNFPFQIKCGFPEEVVTFVGSKYLCLQQAELDAAKKVSDYLKSKFGLHFADWNYEKLLVAEKRICDLEYKINDTVGNVTSMLVNWKAAVGILMQTQKSFSTCVTPLHLAISGELVNVKSEQEACVQHVSAKMKCVRAQYAHCCKPSYDGRREDAVTVKISERDILHSILLSLGLKNAKFNNTLEKNLMFTGSCKISFNDRAGSRSTGKTLFVGDPKKSAYEAECSAAAKAICFVETVLCTEVVDLHFTTLLEKEDTLNRLCSVKREFEKIQDLIDAEWLTMVNQLKAIVKSQYECCKQMDLGLDDNDLMECSDMMDEAVHDITFMYQFCTVAPPLPVEVRRCLCGQSMREGQHKRRRDGVVHSAEVAEGSKKRVFLEMTNLINMAMADIGGPVMEVKSYIWAGGFQSVEMNFDARKVPFQIISGIPEQGVAFCGSKFICEDEAHHDTVIKVADYLYSKFGLRIGDWSYDKAVTAEQKLQEIDNSIQSTAVNINDMLCHWKSSVGLLKNLEKALSATPNPEHMALYGKLITIKCTVKTTIKNISEQMTVTENQHHLYRNESWTKFTEDAPTLKLPETNVINDILFGLGLKVAEFMNRLDENYMFRGICKIGLNGLVTCNTCGPTIFEGDVKETAFEAECNAAAKAINFLERSMGLEIIDVNLHALRRREDLLRGLQCVKNKYIAIENQVSAQWKSMILELKGMVNYQCEFCKNLDGGLQENGIAGCAQTLDEILADTTLLYDLAITSSEQ